MHVGLSVVVLIDDTVHPPCILRDVVVDRCQGVQHMRLDSPLAVVVPSALAAPEQ
jgi:hypothetical protein